MVSLISAQLAVLVIGLIAIVAYSWAWELNEAIVIVAVLSTTGCFLEQFNGVRAAYNEHYVSATLLFLIQSMVYAVGLLVPAARHNMVLSVVVLQGGYWLTNLTTCSLLLRKRMYLLRGRPTMLSFILRRRVMLGVADGSLMATLSFSVVWLETHASASVSAWFGTIVRLFQTFLTPVILLAFPLSSYLRIVWGERSPTQQRALIKATCLLGIGYGVTVAVALLVASSLYVDRLLHLQTPDWRQTVPIFALFGAIVTYSSYSSVAYIVLDQTLHLSAWIAIGTVAALASGAAASMIATPLEAVSSYALTAGFSLIAIVFWHSWLTRTKLSPR